MSGESVVTTPSTAAEVLSIVRLERQPSEGCRAQAVQIAERLFGLQGSQSQVQERCCTAGSRSP